MTSNVGPRAGRVNDSLALHQFPRVYRRQIMTSNVGPRSGRVNVSLALHQFPRVNRRQIMTSNVGPRAGRVNVSLALHQFPRVYRRQIMTSNDGPRAGRVNVSLALQQFPRSMDVRLWRLMTVRWFRLWSSFNLNTTHPISPQEYDNNVHDATLREREGLFEGIFLGHFASPWEEILVIIYIL